MRTLPGQVTVHKGIFCITYSSKCVVNPVEEQHVNYHQTSGVDSNQLVYRFHSKKFLWTKQNTRTRISTDDVRKNIFQELQRILQGAYIQQDVNFMVQVDFILALYIQGLCGRGNQINIYYRIVQLATQLVTVWKEEIINLQQKIFFR